MYNQTVLTAPSVAKSKKPILRVSKKKLLYVLLTVAALTACFIAPYYYVLPTALFVAVIGEGVSLYRDVSSLNFRDCDYSITLQEIISDLD